MSPEEIGGLHPFSSVGLELGDAQGGVPAAGQVDALLPRRQDGPGRGAAAPLQNDSGKHFTAFAPQLGDGGGPGLQTPDLVVELPGGALSVRWDRAAGTMFLTGPAVTVYEGDYPLEDR